MANMEKSYNNYNYLLKLLQKGKVSDFSRLILDIEFT